MLNGITMLSERRVRPLLPKGQDEVGSGKEIEQFHGFYNKFVEAREGR